MRICSIQCSGYHSLHFITVIILYLAKVASSSNYCTKNSTCWPDDDVWLSFIDDMSVVKGDGLYAGKDKVFNVTSPDEDYNKCLEAGANAYDIAESSNGLCMQAHHCSFEFCDSSKDYNLPAYTIIVETEDDIQRTLQFANTYNIAVSVKTTGHSYSGSSTQRDSILIWMAYFEVHGDVFVRDENVTDIGLCENITMKLTNDVIKIGGGATWGVAYDIASKYGYDMVGGGSLTVSAVGGWLQGGGLSALSPSYGLGIDNVIRFDVVLANSSIVTADECNNSDLFWALRGGGGGTYGIVIAAFYKLYEMKSVTTLNMFITLGGVETDTCADSILECPIIAYSGLCTTYYYLCPVSCVWGCSANQVDYESYIASVTSFVDFWVESSPFMDRRWGGYWTGSSLLLTFVGNSEEADSSYGKNVTEWLSLLPDKERNHIWMSMDEHPSYWDSRERGNSTDATGQEELNLSSRHVPRDWVIENKTNAKSVLTELALNLDGTLVTSYLLHGAIADVSSSSTSINPSMRSALWSVHTIAYSSTNDAYNQIIRNAVPNSISGSCYNHGSYKEPDWMTAFWGSNGGKLSEIAQKYDPEKRFNCWHCVGFVNPHDNELATSSPSSLREEIFSPTSLPSVFASEEPTSAEMFSSGPTNSPENILMISSSPSLFESGEILTSSPSTSPELVPISTPSPSISDSDEALTSTPSTSPEKLVMPTSSPIMFASEGPSIAIARKDSSYPSTSPEMRPESSPAVLPLEGPTSGESSSLVNVVGVRGLVIVLLIYDFLY